jgi:hypothetical protein
LLKRIATDLQTCGWENFGMRQELREQLKWKIEGVFLDNTEGRVYLFYANDRGLKTGVIGIKIFGVWMQEDLANRSVDSKPFGLSPERS